MSMVPAEARLGACDPTQAIADFVQGFSIEATRPTAAEIDTLAAIVPKNDFGAPTALSVASTTLLLLESSRIVSWRTFISDRSENLPSRPLAPAASARMLNALVARQSRGITSE